MKKPYTHDFLPDPGARSPNRALDGLSFILYELGFARGLPRWRFAGVLSPYWRLLHCPRGEAGVVFRGKRLALTPEALVLIPAEVESDLTSRGRVDMLYAHFLPRYPLALEPVVTLDRPMRLAANAAEAGLLALLRRLPPGEATTALAMRALLEVCFADLLRPFLGAAARPPPDPRVIRMLACMRARFAEPLGIAALAAAGGLGRDQAMRLCRSVTGRTLHSHLVGIRMAEAARLLAAGEASVKQVAAACGFANRFHFTRVFARRMGLGPAAFRRRVRSAGGEGATGTA